MRHKRSICSIFIEPKFFTGADMRIKNSIVPVDTSVRVQSPLISSEAQWAILFKQLILLFVAIGSESHSNVESFLVSKSESLINGFLIRVHCDLHALLGQKNLALLVSVGDRYNCQYQSEQAASLWLGACFAIFDVHSEFCAKLI